MILPIALLGQMKKGRVVLLLGSGFERNLDSVKMFKPGQGEIIWPY